MDDLISRQELMEHLERTIEASSRNEDYSEGFSDGMDFAVSFASTLPSAQPERKTGHWIKTGNIDHTWLVSSCSNCGRQTIDAGNFCPNCGVDMRGETDG